MQLQWCYQVIIWGFENENIKLLKKSKANDYRRHKLMSETSLTVKCRASQSSLDSANKASVILKHLAIKIARKRFLKTFKKSLKSD